MPELNEVFDLIETFARDRGAEPVSALVEDSTLLCRYVVNTDDIWATITEADVLTHAGASVAISLDVSGSSVPLHSGPAVAGSWNLAGDLRAMGWPEDAETESVQTAALIDHWHGNALVAMASVELLLEKGAWAEPIAKEVGGLVWVGPGLHGFLGWLRDRPPAASLGVLFQSGAAVVLLHGWTGPAVRLGPNLTLAGLDFREKTFPADTRWPEPCEDWQRRALLVEVREAPGILRAPLIRAVAWSAILLLAEETSNDVARPSRDATRRWQLRDLPTDAPDLLPTVVGLAHWVSHESNATRLAVARRIAAARVDDAFSTIAAAAVVEAAEIGYQQAIDSSVRDALDAQIELERTFRSIDGELATLRSGLRETLDQTLLRGVVGLVAIAAAAAATEQKSAGFVLLGSVLVAAYMMFTATIQLMMADRDAKERLQAFEELVAGRGSQTAERMVAVLGKWRIQLSDRTSRMRWGLAVASVVVAVGGSVAASQLHTTEGTPSPTTTTVPTPIVPPPSPPGSRP